MFKKLFVILLALLMLCSCTAKETPAPILPEEPEILEEPEISGETIEIPEEKPETEEIPGTENEEEAEFTEPVEPELVAEHIAMLNELKAETFGIEHESWQVENYYRLYKEKPYGEDFELAKTPDALEPASTFYGITMGEGYMYNGYYLDLNCEGVYPATNFSSKAEVFENLCKWFDPKIIEKSSFDDHVMDFEGEVYLLRHSRGYGMSYYGDSEIVEQTETEMTVITKIYRIIKNEVGTAEIKFEKRDGNWIIISVENNYYNN